MTAATTRRTALAEILAPARGEGEAAGLCEDFADLVLEERMAKQPREERPSASWPSCEDKIKGRLPSESTRCSQTFRQCTLEGEDAPALHALGPGLLRREAAQARCTTLTRRRSARTSRPSAALEAASSPRAERSVRREASSRDDTLAGLAQGACAPIDIQDRLRRHARLGTFYVDLYPRETKRGGAWMHGLISGVAHGAERSLAAPGPDLRQHHAAR